MRPWKRRAGGQLARPPPSHLLWLLPALFFCTLNFALVFQDHHQSAGGLLRLVHCSPSAANRTTRRTWSGEDAREAERREKLRQQQPVISHDNQEMKPASGRNKQQASRVKATTNVPPTAEPAQQQPQAQQQRPTRILKGAASQMTAPAGKRHKSADLRRNKKPLRRPLQQDSSDLQGSGADESAQLQASTSASVPDESLEDLGSAGGLQVSITPRMSLVRVPVESNTILKCLISSQTNKFTKPFKVSWSRFRHDENDYEQIESESYEPDSAPAAATGGSQQRSKRATGAGDASDSRARGREDELQLAGQQAASLDGSGTNSSTSPAHNHSGPPTVIDRQQQLRDFLARSRQEINVISDLLMEATLSISPVRSSDNASYFCTANQGRSGAESGGQQQAQIDLLALSKPEVRLERVQPARDSKSALVVWSIVSDGNTPIHKTILMVRNDSQTLELRQASRHRFQQQQQATDEDQKEAWQGGQPQQQRSSLVVLDGDYNQWQRIDIAADGATSDELAQEEARASRRRRPPPAAYLAELGLAEDSVVRADLDATSASLERNSSPPDSAYSAAERSQTSRRRPREPRRSYNLTHLLPGVTYQLRLAALNDMGQSEWSQLAATMPNEIPAQISELRVLSATNDSLTIGWRRPLYDGARTIRYEMQLFDLNRTLTLDANTNTNSSAQQTQRSAFMFHFVNLQPGTDYHFHIRACSRAGCSAYSAPKLPASTLDGEPDEPLDVELSCEPAIGQLQVTWLPPNQLRGRLLNYTVTLEAQARYLNQSGQWASEQRQARLDTADNHTLSVEFGHGQQGWASENPMRLVPNTNYSARVCANNRSPRCGRWSQLGSKARCSTPPELPAELPANIRLGLKQLKLIDVERTRAEAETLVLELPFISWRNGSIDCIQVILIRLPSSFDSTQRALSEFLPDEPARLKLHSYLELMGTTNATDADSQQWSRPAGTRLRDSQEALAYLAEELDQINQSGSSEELASGVKQILLGDGVQSSCAHVWDKIRQQQPQEPNERKTDESRSKQLAQEGSKRLTQAIDGSLMAQTHYTGFLKLVQLRASSKHQSASSIKRRSSGQLEVLTRYSNYFSPVKTGQQVPEVSVESLLANDRQLANYANGPPNEATSSELDELLCDSKLAVNIENKLGTDRPCKVAVSVLGAIKRTSINYYRRAAGFLGEHLRVDSVARLFSNSSPPIQLLQTGLFVFLVSSLLLFVIYLFTLPSAKRRRRKRQAIKRQLQEHEASALARDNAANQNHSREQQAQQDELVVQALNGNGPGITSSGLQQQRMEPNLQALASSLGYQQVLEPTANGNPTHVEQHAHLAACGTLNRPKECPIHSSPMSQVVSSGHQQQQHGADPTRRQSVHVCQRAADMNLDTGQEEDFADHAHDHHQAEQQLRRHHQHHHHHHRSAYHIHQDQNCEPPKVDWSDARNCRTMRRPQQQQQQQPINGFAESAQVGHYHEYAHEQYASHLTAYASQHLKPIGHANYNMTMQHDTVLALAKKINKSLPLSLFQSIFECRLKNGWLREEYEQLPRVANIQTQPPIAKVNEDGKHIKLRPQLIVSRDDSVSALISGNDNYDGSLVKLQLPAAANANGAHTIEKQFICAKSPTDADSVWDFWRLIYEQEVSSLVMLTPNEDTHTGELRCAQYWPTCDNEETTILSPCNEYVQQSSILPAKFKIRQETLSGFELDGDQEVRSDELKIRRLTLLVMATRPNENDQTDATTPTTTNENKDASKLNSVHSGEPQQTNGISTTNGHRQDAPPVHREAERTSNEDEFNPDDEESLVIIERNLLHFQFLHWNASSTTNQMRLIKFIELVNERHSRQMQQQASPGTHWQQVSPQNPILVHCANGIGRSGLFTAMSLVIDDLTFKMSKLASSRAGSQQQQQMVAKVNLFHLVSKLRSQRDMLLSPYRFYELLYQLTTGCIPAHHNHHYRHQHKGAEQVLAISNQAPS